MRTFAIGQLEIDILHHVRVDGARFPTPDPDSVGEYFIIGARWQGQPIDFYPNEGGRFDPLSFGFVGKKALPVFENQGTEDAPVMIQTGTKRGADFRSRFFPLLARRLAKAILAQQLGRRIGELTAADEAGAGIVVRRLLRNGFVQPVDMRLMTIDGAARFLRDRPAGAIDEGDKPPGTVVNIDCDFDSDAASDGTEAETPNTAIKTGIGNTGVEQRGQFRFPLSSITAGATINDSDLQLNQIAAANVDAGDTVAFNKYGTSDPDTDSAATKFTNSAGATYVSSSGLNGTGSRSFDLGTTADSDIAAQLSSPGRFTIGTDPTTGFAANELINWEAIEHAGTDPATLTVDYSTGVTHSAAAALTAAATLAADGRATYRADTVLPGTVAIAADGRATYRADALLPGVATLTPAGGVRLAGSALLAAVAALAGDPRITASGSVALTGTATLTPAGTLNPSAYAALVATASLAADARATYRADIALSGTADLGAAGGLHHQAIADFVGTALLLATPSFRAQAVANLQAAATLAADAHAYYAAAAALTGSATLAAVSTVYREAAAAFTATATLAASGGYHLSASAALATAATLAAAAKMRYGATTNLAGTATMLAAGSLLLAGIQFDHEIGRAWAMVYDVDDATLLGMLPFIQPAFTLREINLLGYFELMVPETHEATPLISYGRYVRLYYAGKGLRFRGIIEDWELQAAEDGVLVRRVWGPSLAAELAYENTYQDIVIADEAAGTAFTRLMAGAASWTATTTGSYSNQSGRYGLKSLFEAARQFAVRAGGYIRETWTARQIELKNTHTDSGLVLGNPEAHAVIPPAAASIVPLRATPYWRREGRVFNRIIPIGQGAQGEPVSLQRSTRVSPYTIQSKFVRLPRVSDYIATDVRTPDGFESIFSALGENRYAIALIVADGTLAAAASIGGQQMPALYGDAVSAIWAGKPPKGNPQLRMDIAIPSTTLAGIVSLEGVDQVNPLRAQAQSTGTSTTPSITVTSAVGDTVIAWLVLRSLGTPTVTPGTGVNLVGKYVGAFDEDQLTAWQKDGAAGTTTLTWTIAPSQTWEVYAFSLAPALTYYIEDATSIAAYGPGKPRVKTLTDITLSVDRIDDGVAVSNALFDYAVTVLTRAKDPADIVRGQPHYLPDDQILPGDSCRLLFTGLVQTDVDSRRVWKSFDATFIITAIKEKWGDSRREFELTIATSIREALGDWSGEIGQAQADIDLLNTEQANRT